MSMEVKKYIHIAPGFQKSINLAYDLYSTEKIADFIPSKSALEIIEPIMLSTHSNAVDRAHILTGSYGKGKSHILLVLLAMMREKNLEAFARILEALKNYNSQLYAYVSEYLSSDRKLLPIIIQGSSTSLNQSFLYAIQIALKDAELEDLMPDTHFQAALNRLELWQHEFPDTLKRFEGYIAPDSIEDFKARLVQFDSTAYDAFVEEYPRLTSGGEFNPFVGFDVVELYSTVTAALKGRGYQGVFVVYDEFSKYLEANIRGTSISDIKMLQDFAEKCNRSKMAQMHLLLIAHKDIENYIDRLPKNKVDGWRGVSERFTHLEMHSNYGQLYEIMGAAICKEKDFETEYCKKYAEQFTWLKSFVKEQALFNDINDEQRQAVIYGSYPLHPTATFILPRLSELIAQNERTLFTFLSTNSKHTLSDYLDHGSQTLLTSDVLYDYFEPLLKKELYTSDIYKTYVLANSILAQLDRKGLEAKIIKAIALVYIVNQFEKYPPKPDNIIETFYGVYAAEDIIKALEELENKKFVIYAKKSNGYLRLKISNGNVRQLIERTIEREKAIGNAKKILQSFASDTYLYPTRYNDENAIIRYFDFNFLSGNDVFAVNDWNTRISSSDADGVVYAIFPESEEQIAEIRQYLQSEKISSNRVLFILPKSFYNVVDVAYSYKAVACLMAEADGDEALLSEYSIYYEDMSEVLDDYILTFTKPELKQAEYYYQGEKIGIYRKAQLSQQLSQICTTVFPDTPRINNETINKNDLPANTINSRTKVVRGLLENELSPMLGLTGTGQDVSIMRSAFLSTGVIEEITTTPTICVSTCPDERVRNVLTIIERFFANSGSGNGSAFSLLYERLTDAKYGIGMKRGPIPLYIAVILHSYKDHLTIISGGQELEINAELLNSINAKPEAYIVHLVDWTSEKADYIKKLELIFSDYIIEREKGTNSFSYIIKAMQRWYISLPKYAKESKKLYIGAQNFIAVDKDMIRFATALKVPMINPHEFLFEKMTEIFECDTFSIELADKVREAKVTFDLVKKNLIKGVSKDIIQIFAPNSADGITVTSAAKDWYEQLEEKTKNHVFDGSEALLLAQFARTENDRVSFISELAKPATGLRIDDWNNDTIKVFLQVLSDLKRHVTEFNNTEATEEGNGNNSYVLSTIGQNGETQTRTFNHVEYSRMAKLLKNEIMNSLAEMGQAINDSEKRQVLIEVLESLC